MKSVHFMAYAMGAIFILGETSRRGLDYFSINATTMLEDYGSGLLLLLAAAACTAKMANASLYLAGSWGYAAGGMFVPFFAPGVVPPRSQKTVKTRYWTAASNSILQAAWFLFKLGHFLFTNLLRIASGVPGTTGQTKTVKTRSSRANKNGTNTGQKKRNKNGINQVPKRHPNGTRTHPKRSQNGTRTSPKRNQNGTYTLPKRGKHMHTI